MDAFDIPLGFEPLLVGPGFSAHFGPVFVDRVRRRIGFRLASQHLNPVGACHGGALATFADMQIAAVNKGAGSREAHSPTVHLAMDYIAVVPEGTWIEAHVTLLQQTRRLMFTQALIVAGDALLARSNAIYRYYGDASPPPG